jgi:hypothetical protein
MADYDNYKKVKRATEVGGYSTSKEEEEAAIESGNRAMAPIKNKGRLHWSDSKLASPSLVAV